MCHTPDVNHFEFDGFSDKERFDLGGSLIDGVILDCYFLGDVSSLLYNKTSEQVRYSTEARLGISSYIQRDIKWG